MSDLILAQEQSHKYERAHSYMHDRMTDRREIRAERLKQAMADRGLDQEQLANAVGVSQGTISLILTKKTANSRHLPRIADELNVSYSWLDGASENPEHPFKAIGRAVQSKTADEAALINDRRLQFRGADPEQEGAERAEIVWLKEVDQVLGAGGGFFDGGSEERLVPFPAHWLRSSVKAQVQSLVTMPCKGTSMEPTILDGNLCIIDTSRQKIDEQDEIWACAYAGLAVIKRLRAMPDGTVKLMSDNQAVRDEIATDGDLFILGRCVNVLRST